MKPAMLTRYSVLVSVDVPDDDGEPVETKRSIEKYLIRCLRTCDYETDLECVDAKRFDEDGVIVPDPPKEP